MIVRSPALDEFEARYEREAFRDTTYEQALACFGALWDEARAVGADLGSDWLEDLTSDFAVGRALNGLPPAT